MDHSELRGDLKNGDSLVRTHSNFSCLFVIAHCNLAKRITAETPFYYLWMRMSDAVNGGYLMLSGKTLLGIIQELGKWRFLLQYQNTPYFPSRLP